MHAEISDTKKLIVFLVAVLLLAAPIHAQTLQASVSTITIGQVINCNDSQTVNLTSSGGAITFTAAITYNSGDNEGSWLYARNISTTSTTIGTDAPVTMTVPSGTTAGLMVGLNAQIGVSDTATLTLTTTSPAGQTIAIPVKLVASLACPNLTVNNGTLSVEPASLSLTASQGTSTTLDAMVTNISSNPVTFVAQPSPLAPWMSIGLGTVTLASGQSIGIPVTGSAGTLMPGPYSSFFEIFWGTTNSPIFIPVTLTVTTNGVGPTITTGVKVSSPVLNFNWVPGNATPPGQQVVVSNQVGTQPIPIAVSVTQYNGPPNWLKTNYTSGAQTAYALGVGVTTTGLTPGITYQGSLTITPYLGPAVEIYVSLAVTAAPVATATPTSLTFNYTQGGTPPPGQTVIVTGGGNVVEYSTAAIIPGWLSAYPATGGAPNGSLPLGTPPGGGAFLWVNVNPSGLTAGTYTGTVTVYGSGPAVGNTNIAVTLIVTGPAVKTVSNAASYMSGPVAPGEMVALFTDSSTAFGPASGVPLTSDLIVDNKLPTSMGGVQVFFNGVAAPLIYVSATQINAVVPYEVAGAPSVQVAVEYLGQTSAPVSLQAAAVQPAVFTATSRGTGQGAIGQYDASGNYQGMNSADNPVTRGNVITLYVTGEGRTQSPVTGLITSAQATAPYTPQPQIAPSVLIDGQPATVLFYGEVPGVVAGMMQVNVIVPQSARTGSVPVSVAMGTGYSQAGVTLVAQ